MTTGTAYTDLAYVNGRVMNGDDTPAAGATIAVVFSDGSSDVATTSANGTFTVLYEEGLSISTITWKRSGDPVTDLVAPAIR